MLKDGITNAYICSNDSMIKSISKLIKDYNKTTEKYVDIYNNIRNKLNEHFSKYKQFGFKVKCLDPKSPSFDINENRSMYDTTLNVKVIIPKEKKVKKLIKSENEFDKCTICCEYKKNYVINCGHLFCSNCVDSSDVCHLCSKIITTKKMVYL
jgi:hypothetical protein